MKTTDKIAFAAILTGAAAGAGFYWLFPGGPWLIYVGVGVIVNVVAYLNWIKLAADENLANRNDD